MKSYPRISIIDPHDADAVIVEVCLIPEADAGAFVAEIADALGGLLGVSRQVALELFAVDLRDAIACPVPSAFELSPHIRRGFARDVAALVRTAIGAVDRAAA